ncbi:hypothetical protein FQA39_LY04260 [Lamprigera yunnana]|nr:hypothetical protein FQA39_LY04260 [Lamprigera yunnana]
MAAGHHPFSLKPQQRAVTRKPQSQLSIASSTSTIDSSIGEQRGIRYFPTTTINRSLTATENRNPLNSVILSKRKTNSNQSLSQAITYVAPTRNRLPSLGYIQEQYSPTSRRKSRPSVRPSDADTTAETFVNYNQPAAWISTVNNNRTRSVTPPSATATKHVQFLHESSRTPREKTTKSKFGVTNLFKRLKLFDHKSAGAPKYVETDREHPNSYSYIAEEENTDFNVARENLLRYPKNYRETTTSAFPTHVQAEPNLRNTNEFITNTIEIRNDSYSDNFNQKYYSYSSTKGLVNRFSSRSFFNMFGGGLKLKERLVVAFSIAAVLFTLLLVVDLQMDFGLSGHHIVPSHGRVKYVNDADGPGAAYNSFKKRFLQKTHSASNNNASIETTGPTSGLDKVAENKLRSKKEEIKKKDEEHDDFSDLMDYMMLGPAEQEKHRIDVDREHVVVQKSMEGDLIKIDNPTIAEIKKVKIRHRVLAAFINIPVNFGTSSIKTAVHDYKKLTSLGPRPPMHQDLTFRAKPNLWLIVNFQVVVLKPTLILILF